MKAGIGFTKLFPAEQPLREGARQRRRMDPRGGLKTNVKRSISRACHFERSERSLPFAVRDSRFPHICLALLRFSHLSFIPLEPYPARFARHLPHGGRRYSHFPPLRRISPLSFIPPVPYPPLRGTFPGGLTIRGNLPSQTFGHRQIYTAAKPPPQP